MEKVNQGDSNTPHETCDRLSHIPPGYQVCNRYYVPFTNCHVIKHLIFDLLWTGTWSSVETLQPKNHIGSGFCCIMNSLENIIISSK